MKRLPLVVILLLCWQTIAFSAFTEWYCTNGGTNLNAGSTTGNTAVYTSAGGNWVQATRVFTPTDGSTPASTVSVGDFASVYVTAGATTTGYVSRVTAVGAGVNGTITLSGTNSAGSAPANGTGTITLKTGGAWKGPAAAVTFPFNFNLTNLVNTSGDVPRINLKNDQTYTMSTGISVVGSNVTVRGYSSSVADGGRATIDGSTNAIVPLTISSQNLIDIIVLSSATSGSNDLITVSSSASLIRVTASGSRGNGINCQSSSSLLYECEINNSNKSNTSAKAALQITSNTTVYRCILSNNTGSNTDGIVVAANAGPVFIMNNAIFGCGRHGISYQSAGITSPGLIAQNELYSNGGDGIKNILTTTHSLTIIENNNFVKNTGWGINSAITTGYWLGEFNNNGFGSGTQVNGSGSTNGTSNLSITGSVTYTANTTPWVDPANGNFKINNTQAYGAGRGNFTETQGSLSGTVGYPDIGAAQHSDTCGGTGPCQTSGASAY